MGILKSTLGKLGSIVIKKDLTIDENHFLRKPVERIFSPNFGELFTFPLRPFYLVIHYTATLTADHAIKLLTDPKNEASAHLVVDRDGGISQLVPFNRLAWHAGKSEWKGQTSINKCSIGIEIVNAGKLDFEDNKYLTWDKKEVPSKDVQPQPDLNNHPTFWHKYTKQQLIALDEIVALLKSRYEISEVLMHSEIAPERKIDPGPIFPIERFR